MLIFGNGGFFKTNTTAQVGGCSTGRATTAATAPIRSSMSAPISARFIAPLICGTLGEEVGWHYGFGAAGIGMIIALSVYLGGPGRILPHEGLRDRTAGRRSAHRRSTARNGNRSLALILLVVPLTLWWACYEQQGNIIALFADANTDRRLIPGLIELQSR